jgi:hypothetical protein
MALQVNYNSQEYGILANNAYAKIDAFRGDINEVQFDVNYYVSQEARVANKNPIGMFMFVIPYVDGMTYSSVYNHLKTLPGFENAVDC